MIKRQFCEGAKNDCVAYYVSYTKGSKGEKPLSHHTMPARKGGGGSVHDTVDMEAGD